MSEIEFPPPALEGESRINWERRALNPWRNQMKAWLFVERGPMCEREGCHNRATQLDEAIVPRCDMRGFSPDQRRIAFGEINLALLCADCNCNQAHDRTGAFERACQRYGRETVTDWYHSLNLRAPDRRFT